MTILGSALVPGRRPARRGERRDLAGVAFDTAGMFAEPVALVKADCSSLCARRVTLSLLFERTFVLILVLTGETRCAPCVTRS